MVGCERIACTCDLQLLDVPAERTCWPKYVYWSTYVSNSRFGIDVGPINSRVIDVYPKTFERIGHCVNEACYATREEVRARRFLRSLKRDGCNSIQPDSTTILIRTIPTSLSISVRCNRFSCKRPETIPHLGIWPLRVLNGCGLNKPIHLHTSTSSG